MPSTLTTTAVDPLLTQRAVDVSVTRDVDALSRTTAAVDLSVTTEAHTELSMATEVEVGTIWKNELPDPATFVFEKADGTARDLTGATVEGYLRKPDGTVKSWLSMTIADATGGKVEYAWQDGDTDTASIGGVGLKLVAVVTLGGKRFFSDVMVVQVSDTYASHESFATL